MTKISCQKRGNFFYIKELNFSYPGQKTVEIGSLGQQIRIFFA